MNPLQNVTSIRLKIFIIIAISITFAFLAFDLIMLNHQKNIYVEDLLFNAHSVSDTILKSLEQDMMAADTVSITTTLKAIGEQEIIKELRINNQSEKCVHPWRRMKSEWYSFPKRNPASVPSAIRLEMKKTGPRIC